MAEGRIPLPSIRRFPSYLRILMQKKDAGERDISATLLAHELGLTAIQVRKDLASTGVEGRPKVGFSIEELVVAITHSLGWDNAAEALIIGAGNLGSGERALRALPLVCELSHNHLMDDRGIEFGAEHLVIEGYGARFFSGLFI